MWCHFLPTIRSSSRYPCTEQKIVFPEADSDVKRFQRCSSCLYFASSFVTSSQVCSSNPNPDVFGQNTSVFTRAVTGWWVSNKHVRKEQTCASGLDEITKLPRHVIPWSYFNLCFLLSSSSSVCFIVLPVVFFFVLYFAQEGFFQKRLRFRGCSHGAPPPVTGGGSQEQTGGSRNETSEWWEDEQTSEDHRVCPPCRLPFLFPPPLVRLSLPDFLASLCASCFFFSLSVSLLLLFLTAPSPHYVPRSLTPSLAPVCFNSCICIFSTAALVLPSSWWLELSRNVDLLLSVGLILPVIFKLRLPLVRRGLHANKVCGRSCVNQKHCILWSDQRPCVYTMCI